MILFYLLIALLSIFKAILQFFCTHLPPFADMARDSLPLTNQLLAFLPFQRYNHTGSAFLLCKSTANQPTVNDLKFIEEIPYDKQQYPPSSKSNKA